MIKAIQKFILLSLIFLSTASALELEDKMYINENQLKSSYDRFHIHLGENVWIETTALNRDEQGLFTFETNIITEANSKSFNDEYVKKWQCPYCHKFWPYGSACQNTGCPSRFK